ncbi:hypothetical protein CWC48_25845 [Pseudomonas sp. S10E 269]|uniref:hypothetical protein n=1 Tax=unclassified Pseudomonas TaxID=196821 RepID=UPI000C25C59C|nr:MULTISPECIES: hypothetical protein [unclassified Pseudomonas]PJK32922.1 hypothetical protein CWC49_06290 [Pseudomonas sp. S09F 262]PJK42413.1 hypothetical protein CWC48_25845 [Pseudomonas sp. S10E 269]
MRDATHQNESFAIEFKDRIAAFSEQQAVKFFNLVLDLGETYGTGYQFEGAIHLVLDNSVIQSYKHRNTQPHRELQALAYTAFCRFVTGWGDRETYLALSPAAIYEHLGRPDQVTRTQIERACAELSEYFSETGLKIKMIGFRSPSELMQHLQAIAADDKYLSDYFKEVEFSDWKTDLRAPFGVKIPLNIAFSKIPDNLPLQYFSPWYVKFVLSSRVERLIAQQSQQNIEARPIMSGELSESLAAMNDFTKKGVLRGLGDIDMLQLCDINSQYQSKASQVLLGQTFDKGLSKVLHHRTVFFESSYIEYGTAQTEAQIEASVRLMTSNPFKAQDARAEKFSEYLSSFCETLKTTCIEAQKKAR